MSEAGDLIRALQRAGMSQRAIADALGRGPSYVSKVATGAKPGANLLAGLRALQGGATSAPVERRRRRSGELARVRAGKGARSRVPSAPSRPTRRAAGRERAGTAAAIAAGMAPDGRSGTSAAGPWELAAWRGPDGWHHGAPITNPAAVQYVIIDVPGVGFRQKAVFLTDDYDLADVVAELYDDYGVAE